MNDFIDAINNSKSDEESENPSSERYNQVKQEEADVESETPAEKRFNALKEEAKDDLKKKEIKAQKESEEKNEDEDSGFVTH